MKMITKKNKENIPGINQLSKEELKNILGSPPSDNPPSENPLPDVEVEIESDTPSDHNYPGEKRGPKVKWTEEKIKELKESKRLAAEERRREREANERFVKQNVNYPISKAEKEKIVDGLINTKNEIQKTIIDKRDILRNASGIILNVNKCSHLYEFKYFKEDIFVTACKNCSAIKNFTEYEWTIYKRKNK